MCMYKKCVCLISLVFMLGMVSNAPAVDRNWTNTNGNRLWSTAANWSGSVVPTSADKACVRNQAVLGPIINSGTNAVANQIVVGDWSSANDTLDMTGGTLTTSGTSAWFILGYSATNKGTFTISAGTVNIASNFFVGNSGTGIVQITGGTITVTGTFGIAQLAGSTGDVFLDGGTITCGTFNMTSGGGMDITTGKLIVTGDVTTLINTYKTNGWITAYDGSGTVNVSYNTPNAGKTTVTATSGSGGLPGKATSPIPANGATGINTGADIIWTPGTGATSHDVYFGIDSTPDSTEFKVNQTGNGYDVGTLANSTKYYWRIDEKNATGTTTGDVWSFTTVAASSYSLIGKVMCGYQGWFNCPSDGTTRGWVHWGPSTFSPTKCTVDMWPDTTEMTTGEKFLASAFYDGKDRYVFSSHNLTTVRRHFQWMQQNGIDGVYLQRFATELTPGSAAFNHRNDVLAYCKDAANLYGRKYAVMYDLSGLSSGGTSKVIADWKYLVDNAKVPNVSSADPAYMFHNGKRVVAVWGVGYSGRAYTNAEVKTLVNFLKNDATYGGNIVMIGVPTSWRSNTNADVKATHLLADIISPWTVGGYTSTSAINSWATSKGVPDKSWCNTNNKLYLPVIWPGFSWHNKYPSDPLNQIPRKGGQFLWDQVKANISTVGANMLYVAMFDEVDEGTAIFKVTNDPPKPGGATMFVTYEGKPSDEYLWLVGQAGRGLRGEITVNQTRPAR